MATITLGTLLDRIETFEEHLEEFFAAVRDRSHDNGVRLLTYYLARHRRHLQQAFEDFEKQDIARIRRVKLGHDIPFAPETERSLLQASPESVTGRALLEAAVAYNSHLVQFYSSILKVPLNKNATFLVLSLIRIEERNTLALNKMIAMHYF